MENSENTTRSAMFKEIAVYLGKENKELLKSMSEEEWDLFGRIKKLERKESYFVKGSRDLLMKFKAFFLFSFSSVHLPYEMCMLKEYVEKLSHSDDDSFLQVNKDILFLYCHQCPPGVGGTEGWVSATAVDKIANRKRKGLVTVVLSERDMPLIEGSKELVIINLGGAVRLRESEAVAQSIAGMKQAQPTTSKLGMSNNTVY